VNSRCTLHATSRIHDRRHCHRQLPTVANDFNIACFESVKLKNAIEILGCGIPFGFENFQIPCSSLSLSLSLSFSLSLSLSLLSLIPNIGVSVYIIHLPWIAVYNFRAAICAAIRSSSACECISGTIFLGAPVEGSGIFPSVSSVRDCAKFSYAPYTEKLHLENGLLLFSIELHHSLWLLLIEIHSLFVKRFTYWITV